MTRTGMTLQGFVYGEDRDGSRSLGFKLLAPTTAPWASEVESLARKLQACPYPDGWQPAELFCSVLLADGQRLIALARYGLRDHSANPRPGGLELIGGVGPADISVSRARAVVSWLGQRRREIDDPRGIAGLIPVDSMPAAPPSFAAEVPPTTAQLSLSGTLILTGHAPDQPDRSLGILENAPPRWQWLPYCGPDFPFEFHAQRGPLIAWLPPRVDLALLIPRPRPEPEAAVAPRRSWLVPALYSAVLLLAALNFWAWYVLPGRLPTPVAEVRPATVDKRKEVPSPIETRERFAQALYRLAASRTGGKLLESEGSLRALYQQLLVSDPDLRCENQEGQALVGVVSQLMQYHPDRIARVILEEFGDKKGIDPEVVRLISERVRQRLVRELKIDK